MRGLGPNVASVVRPTEVELLDLFYSNIQLVLLLSPYFLFFISFLYIAKYVLIDKKVIFLANQASVCLDPHQN